MGSENRSNSRVLSLSSSSKDDTSFGYFAEERHP